MNLECVTWLFRFKRGSTDQNLQQISDATRENLGATQSIFSSVLTEVTETKFLPASNESGGWFLNRIITIGGFKTIFEVSIFVKPQWECCSQ